MLISLLEQEETTDSTKETLIETLTSEATDLLELGIMLSGEGLEGTQTDCKINTRLGTINSMLILAETL